MGNRFPSFQWYPDDWLGSTARATMSRGERSAYLDLMCHYWNSGCKGLENNSRTLMQLCAWPGMPKESLLKITSYFKQSRGGKLHHAKLQGIYRERVTHAEGQKEAGKRGARKRWGAHKEPIGVATVSPLGFDGSLSPSPSPSPSSSPEREEGEKTDPLPPLGIDLQPSLEGTPHEVVRFLMKTAAVAKIPNNPDTLRRYIEAWVARSSGAEVERILMLPECQGRNVIEIQDAHFSDKKKGKSGADAWAAGEEKGERS